MNDERDQGPDQDDWDQERMTKLLGGDQARAQCWLAYGWFPEDAEPWIELARCCDPQAAAFLQEFGLTAEQCSRKIKGWRIGELVAAGDMSPSAAYRHIQQCPQPF